LPLVSVKRKSIKRTSFSSINLTTSFTDMAKLLIVRSITMGKQAKLALQSAYCGTTGA
jgi:hypothetical protein